MRKLLTARIGTLAMIIAFSGCVAQSLAGLERKYAEAERTGQCFVHREQMVRARIPVLHGYVTWGEKGPGRRRSQEFPFASSHVMDGGPLTPDSPTHSSVWRCPSCTKAKRTWMTAHPDDPWTKEELRLEKAEPNPASQPTR